MKLSARLILLLTFSVSVVMAVASLITLRQREAALLDAARDEARVHAVTLQIALEEDYLTGRSLDAQRLINRLRENTGVYSAALFDSVGEIVAISNTLAPEEFRYLNEAREAMASGNGLEIMRSISGEDYFSMILPLQVQGRRVGAIEIVQSISFVKADIARALSRFDHDVAVVRRHPAGCGGGDSVQPGAAHTRVARRRRGPRAR